MRVASLHGAFFRREVGVDSVRKLVGGYSRTERGALKVCHLVGSDTKNKRLKWASLIAVSGQRVQHGEQNLLRRIVRGEISSWGATETPTAVAENQWADMGKQRLRGSDIAVGSKPDEAAQITVLRPMENRAYLRLCYITAHVTADRVTAGSPP
jgi:hypothetical protein